MLVLARLLRQRIAIQVPGRTEPIWVSVQEIEPGKVRLGFVAEKDVMILREELYKPAGVPPAPPA